MRVHPPRYDSRDGYGRHDREDSYVAADAVSPDYACPAPLRLRPPHRPRLPPFPDRSPTATPPARPEPPRCTTVSRATRPNSTVTRTVWPARFRSTTTPQKGLRGSGRQTYRVLGRSGSICVDHHRRPLRPEQRFDLVLAHRRRIRQPELIFGLMSTSARRRWSAAPSPTARRSSS